MYRFFWGSVYFIYWNIKCICRLDLKINRNEEFSKQLFNEENLISLEPEIRAMPFIITWGYVWFIFNISTVKCLRKNSLCFNLNWTMKHIQFSSLKKELARCMSRLILFVLSVSSSEAREDRGIYKLKKNLAQSWTRSDIPY